MSTIIQNGTGKALFAKVDDSNRLHTFSTIESGFRSAKKNGGAFFISSGIIELTSDNESGVLYIKSNENSLISIASITVRCGTSVGGATDDYIRRDYTLPSTGTLITEAKPAVVANLLAADSRVLDADTFLGAEGDTVGGTPFTDDMLQLTDSIRNEGSGFIVPKGTSLGMSITPPIGNTSMKFQVTVTLYLLDAE